MEITRKAYGKINLGLDVVRRMENGYHQVKMIMQTVNIYDELTFTTKEEQGITIETDKGELPTDEHNLIYKAVLALTRRTSLPMGVRVYLKKNIPIAAGMAGGSTDASATFLALNELFHMGYSKKELCEMAVEVGADVPYCIMGGTALSEGIGEILTILPAPPKCYLVVAKPDISVSTQYVYENLHANELKHHPDIDGMVEAIKAKNLKGITDRMENVLENVTIKEYPVITKIKEHLLEKGAENALMSGSGPTVFGIFREEDTAQKAYESLAETKLARQLFVTTLVNEEISVHTQK